MKQLLLLGAGHAHIQVLRRWALRPLRGVDITLVSPFARPVYSGMVPGLVAGHFTLDDCRFELAPLAEAAGARWLEAAASGLDAATRQVRLLDGRVLGCDLLSIDTGADVDADALPGAREHAVFVRPIEHFVQAWEDRLRQLARSMTSVRDLTVIGGGAGGVELALALQHRLQARARVSLLAGEGGLLPNHAPGVRRRMQAALSGHGVSVLAQRGVEVTAREVLLADGTRRPCDWAVAAPGARAPAWLAPSGLALDDKGHVLTGPTLQSTSHPEVFAAGDVASRWDAPHPKNGVHAVRAGPPLAVNLERRLAGLSLKRHHPQRRWLSLLACGERHAVAGWGGLSFEGDWVWRWKERIDRAHLRRCRPPF